MRTSEQQRTRRSDARANREMILLASAETFRDDPDASIDQVAERAGLSRRSIYGHFPSRDALMVELVARGSERMAQALEGVHDADPAVHIARIGAAAWSQIAHVRLVARAVVQGPIDAIVLDRLAAVRGSIRDAVIRGVGAGRFRADVAPERLARLIEAVAIDVLREAVEHDLDDASARRLVMTSALGIAGLSWQDADAAAERAAISDGVGETGGADEADGASE